MVEGGSRRGEGRAFELPKPAPGILPRGDVVFEREAGCAEGPLLSINPLAERWTALEAWQAQHARVNELAEQ